MEKISISKGYEQDDQEKIKKAFIAKLKGFGFDEKAFLDSDAGIVVATRKIEDDGKLLTTGFGEIRTQLEILQKIAKALKIYMRQLMEIKNGN